MISDRGDLRFGKLIDLPSWPVVVAGYRNIQRLWDGWAYRLPGSDTFQQAIQQAENVVRLRADSRSLECICETAYQVAARIAASHRVNPDQLSTRVAQAIHFIIDAVADYEFDSDSSLFMASRSMELSSQLGDERLVSAMLSDCRWISQSIRRSIPREAVLDAFGSLWPE